ncbi:MAG: DNA-3-methyladenine glycosylase family protein [Solirubrobacterales bacterium]
MEIDVQPRSPFRLPARGSSVMRVVNGVVHRLLHVDGIPIVVRAWQQPDGAITFRAEQVDGSSDSGRCEIAIDRMRFALCIDDDMSGFYERFKRDPLLGPVISRKPWIRPRRTVWPWQALLRAICKQLIESGRAAAIERRIVRRWGTRASFVRPATPGGEAEDVAELSLLDVPGPEPISGCAPAELVACDLAEGRALAMVKAAREVAAGRADLFDPGSDRRLLGIHEIGPWTVQCLGLDGRGDPDSLPAGDLVYIKLVGRLAGEGRRATVEEVEEFFAPYEPYRGLAGTFALVGLHKHIVAGKPLRLAA